MWQRFGPYHLARLRETAAMLAADDWLVTGVEVAEQDHYAWDPAVDATINHVTMFAGRDYNSLSSHLIRARTPELLDRLQPSAMCINGWSATEATAALRWCLVNHRRAILMSGTFESSWNPLKQLIKRVLVRKFDAAVVSGRKHAEYLYELGYPPEKIHLGYDVVDNQHFMNDIDGDDIRLPVARGRYFFANTRFLPRKGVDALLRAYARYLSLHAGTPASEPPWQLVISGSGEMEGLLKQLCRALQIAERVHWPGFLQYRHLPTVYRSAGAFVHLARTEAWGLVINEAAAAGLPLLVGRRVGAACELVREGKNGFLVDPDDTVTVAEALWRLARMTDSQRAAMGAESRSIVANFGPRRFAESVRSCIGMAA
jgi:glycosyltransferase involved in cell wall biosynthesis